MIVRLKKRIFLYEIMKREIVEYPNSISNNVRVFGFRYIYNNNKLRLLDKHKDDSLIYLDYFLFKSHEKRDLLVMFEGL